MENEKGSESNINKDPNTHNEATKNGGGDPLSKSASSSSSSSNPPLDLDEKDGVDNPEWSMVSASPRSGTGPSPRLSPPIQTMDRPDDYDPDRIPSSVFNSPNNGAAAMEWSVASNESLFSIHMGNNSFSRDQILLTKSGELTNSQSGNDFSNVPPQTLPTVHEGVPSNEDSNEEGDCETPKMGPTKKETDGGDNLKKEKVVVHEAPPRTFASPPRLSDDSSKSFAFPVLASEGGSVKPVPDTPHITAQARPKPKPNPKLEPETEPEASPQTAGETPSVRKKWFPCLSCCPFCC